ncbi:MAG: tRNA pseudouridine(55) synthase TruB [Anaerolineae bacterium]|nr:tRNA pseudouridine(55) synthase TruB [Anaerolineae bacterium]
MVFGLLNVDKPSGPTSHDIVLAVRRGTGEKRIGHAGTLDPLARGVLVLALGQATRLVEYLVASQKSYLAEITLGIETATYDAEGDVVAQYPLPDDLSIEAFRPILQRFTGQIEQVPPVYSAIKIQGKAAYARVRKGERVDLPPRSVEIKRLDLIEFDPPILRISVDCSPGTYIRSLASDIGKALGCGAMLSGLVRTASGGFSQEDAVSWEELQQSFEDRTWMKHLLPADAALDGFPRLDLTADQVKVVMNGGPVGDDRVSTGIARAYSSEGRFIAVMVGDPDRQIWKPKKVFTQVE